MNIPANLKYTKTHEWVKITGNTARVGITDFAQHELTDIVFVELPKKDAALSCGKGCCVVESVKTASDVYAPLSGRVIKINEKAQEAPELVNSDPYGEGWLFELEMKDSGEVSKLLTPDEYKKAVGEK